MFDSSSERYYATTALASNEIELLDLTSTETMVYATASGGVHHVIDAGLFAGETALMHSTWEGDTKTTEILIAAGADINATDSNGFTALDYAEKSLENHSNQLSEGSIKLSNLEKIVALLNENGAENGKQDVN